MKKLKMNKGITLIAFVVTNVVLLILASISIATLTGDSGLIQKSKMAKENAEIEDSIKYLVTFTDKKNLSSRWNRYSC